MYKLSLTVINRIWYWCKVFHRTWARFLHLKLQNSSWSFQWRFRKMRAFSKKNFEFLKNDAHLVQAVVLNLDRPSENVKGNEYVNLGRFIKRGVRILMYIFVQAWMLRNYVMIILERWLRTWLKYRFPIQNPLSPRLCKLVHYVCSIFYVLKNMICLWK